MATTIMAGHSMGGSLALETGLQLDDRIGGVIAIHLFLPLPDKPVFYLSIIPIRHTNNIYI